MLNGRVPASDQNDDDDLEEIKDSTEYYTMLMDTKLKEQCGPMNIKVSEMQEKLHSSERIIRELTQQIEKVDQHYKQCCRMICAT
jgi:hypothetical protein